MKPGKPGDIYLDTNGNPHGLVSYMPEPSAVLENVCQGFKTTGGLTSLNLQPFTRLEDIDDVDVLKKCIRTLVVYCRMYREEGASD